MALFEPKTQKNQGLPIFMSDEKGGVIVWILVMVALFAALSYAVSQGSRGGASNLTEKQAQLAATEILGYASQVKNAVRQLQINGCDDTEISFDQAFVSGYSNPNSPSDNSCDIFSVNGGSIRYEAPNANWLDNTKSSDEEYGAWLFTNDVEVLNIGNQPDAELLITLPYLEKQICLQANNLLDVDNPADEAPADDGFDFTSIKFIGAYANNHAIADDGGATELLNKAAACYLDDNNFYTFYQVLIAR